MFEFDLTANELRRNAVKVRLQEQPFQILTMLLEKPGEIVGREEIRKRLWSSDTFVDFDHSLNSAVNKLREALGEKTGIRRFGDALVPLDEVLVQAAVDLSGRPYLVHRQPEIVELIGTFDTTLVRHIWESIVAEAHIALHIRVLEGRNAHHVFEAQFKAVARALREAVTVDSRVAGIPSTKGSL